MAIAVCRRAGCPERWAEHDLGDMDLGMTRAVQCGGCGEPMEVDVELGADIPPEPEPEPTALELLESRIAALEAQKAQPAEQS